MPDPLLSLIIGVAVLLLLSLLVWPKGGLIGYLQRNRRLSGRVLREDALKHIHNAEASSQTANLESVAGALQISVAQVYSLLTDLQEQALVEMQGEAFRLTAEGRSYALHIIRSHRLWERYLAEETGFEESQWHELAERQEHSMTPAEVDALAAQLGNPSHDPHGDPIPTASGEISPHGSQPLPSIPENAAVRIVHMEDEPEAVYAQLVAEGLHPGMAVRMLENNPQRVRFWANGDEHLLAPLLAASISVVPLLDKQPPPEEVCSGVPLHTLKPGQSGEVLELSHRLRGTERRRMMDLGILPGTMITAEFASPGGDPVAYNIRGALIALRTEQADLICITPMPGGAAQQMDENSPAILETVP
ncbi:DtxR family transcriptional regulator [Chloroflexota bacterium]